MMQRVVAVVVILAIVLGGGYYAIQALFPKAEPAQAGPVYATAPVTRGDISVSVDAQGPLYPNNAGGIMLPYDYTGGSQVSYVFDHYTVQEGDAVKAGDVVVVLKAPSLETTLEQDRQKLQQDTQQLADLLGVPPDQVLSVNPNAGVTLRAPIAGRVNDLSLQEGGKVTSGTTVAKIVDDSQFYITANVLPGEFDGIKTGIAAYLRFPQFDGIVKGTVTNVNPNSVPMQNSKLDACGTTSDDSGYTYIYWVTISAPNPGLIVPGMTAQVGFPPAGKSSASESEIRWLRYCQSVAGYSNESTVVSPVDATVTKLYVQNMAVVRAGDPIVGMAGSDVVKQIRDLQDLVRQDQQKLAQDQAAAAQLTVRAPTSGIVVGLQPMSPGQAVQNGQWFGQVFDTDNMQMNVQVSDVDVAKIKQGAEVTVTVDALPGQTFKGTVSQVAMMGKDQSGQTQFSVLIDVVGGPDLRPGMQGNAHIDAGHATDALLVPIEALFEDNGRPAVEVLNDDGTTSTVPVEVGLMNDRYVQILSGLEEGQKVITGSSVDLLPSQHITNPGGGILPSPGGGSEGTGQPPAGGGK
ncbi:MAG: efflux RND transporter periplasmic adaptor subunit [Clostridia bacterium]|nr:efflux RND transporter periplasmic adaptor subunit [Clostridia bacterium]